LSAENIFLFRILILPPRALCSPGGQFAPTDGSRYVQIYSSSTLWYWL